MVVAQIISSIQSALQKLRLPVSTIELEHPADSRFGDYSTNIALKTRNLPDAVDDKQRNPRAIAEHIVSELTKDTDLKKIVSKIEIAGPGFINLWLSSEYLLETLAHITKEQNAYGTSAQNKGKKVIVEYSSPNIAKPFTVGHLRSTIIGDAIANILQATGWTVYRDNHVGDWGTQFGKQIYAIKEWGNEREIDNSPRPVRMLVDLYIKFHAEAEGHPELEDRAREWFKKLEEGDKEARRIWQKCIDWSWKEFSTIYQQLGVVFTENNGRGYGESFFQNKMGPVVQELEEKSLLTESEGARLVFFPNEQFPPLMILKKDGATLYATRDLATDKFRIKTYGKDIMIVNEVGAEQSMYFKQLFRLEEMLGWFELQHRVHVSHGMYRFKDQKMSTRKGNVIWLTDVLAEAEKRAAALSKDDEMSPEGNAHVVSIGAIKWNDLKRTPEQDIIFDWDTMLTMEGNSGPYMQYTYARCQSVLINAGSVSVAADKPDIGSVGGEELTLLRTLYKYPDMVARAGEMFSPNIIANYLYELAQTYNTFYQKVPIIKSSDKEKQLRLAITAATAQIIKNGLNLLGIGVLEKM